MDNYNLRLTFTLSVSREDLNDIRGVAMFGGIDYWAHVEYNEDMEPERFLNDDAYDLYDCEDGTRLGVLDETSMLKGIELAVEGGYWKEYKWYEFSEGNHIKINTYNVDADVADVIVQLGVLGEIVYG